LFINNKMKMELELIEKNIVILGNFRPVKFDKLFFIKNNLLREEDFLENSIFMTEFSLIETKDFTLNISQQQIVINTKNPNENNNIQNIAAEIIKIKDIQINAVGYNLKWFMFLKNELNNFTKDLFYSSNNNVINKYFSSEDTVYGYYVSKNYKYSRLKLDVKPILVQKIDTNEKRKVLNFDFNFHIDNKYTNDELSELVLEYETFINEANKIVNEYE
jgi:hypothetical protein